MVFPLAGAFRWRWRICLPNRFCLHSFPISSHFLAPLSLITLESIFLHTIQKCCSLSACIAPFTEIQAGLSSSPLVSQSQQPSPHTDQIGNEAQRVSSSTPGHISQDLKEPLLLYPAVQSLSRVWLFAPHGLQHARLPCPSPTPRACSNSSPSSRWYHPTILSSVIRFSSCTQSFPAWGSLPMSQLFTSSGQRAIPLTPD